MDHVCLNEMNALHLHQTASPILDQEDYNRVVNHLSECSLCRERWIFDKDLGWYRDRALIEAEVLEMGFLSLRRLPVETYRKIDKLIDYYIATKECTIEECFKRLFSMKIDNEIKLGYQRVFQALDFMSRHNLTPEDIYGVKFNKEKGMGSVTIGIIGLEG